MQGPDNQMMANNGCYLLVEENKNLIWTNMLKKDFCPTVDEKMGFPFVVTMTLSKRGGDTLYRAVAAHTDAVGKKQHEKMGFQEGWGIAFNQLVNILGN